MADYTIILKHREEVAEDTMAFCFDIAGTGYTFKAGPRCLPAQAHASRLLRVVTQPHGRSTQCTRFAYMPPQ
jgi:hypothetical protein